MKWPSAHPLRAASTTHTRSVDRRLDPRRVLPPIRAERGSRRRRRMLAAGAEEVSAAGKAETGRGRLPTSRSELGERDRQCPLHWHWDEREVQKLVRVGTHQAGGVADAGVAAAVGGEREQIPEELLDP